MLSEDFVDQRGLDLLICIEAGESKNTLLEYQVSGMVLREGRVRVDFQSALIPVVKQTLSGLRTHGNQRAV